MENMKKILAVILTIMLYSVSLFALSPEIKLDMLKTKLLEELKSKEYTRAVKR